MHTISDLRIVWTKIDRKRESCEGTTSSTYAIDATPALPKGAKKSVAKTIKNLTEAGRR